MTENYHGVIYKATNRVNGKVYIGQTIQGLRARQLRHMQDAKNNKDTVFCRALRKYGEESFDWEIIDYGYSPDDLDAKEVYWIFHHNSYVNEENSNGYNMKYGGRGLSGELNPISKLNNAMIIELLNLALTGKYAVEDLSIKFEVDKRTIWRLFYFESGWNNVIFNNFTDNEIKEAVEKLKHRGQIVASEKISKLKSKENHHMWGRKAEHNPNSKLVYQIDLETGEILREFPSATEASKHVGAKDCSKIAMVCRAKRNKAFGYKWAYKDK